MSSFSIGYLENEKRSHWLTLGHTSEIIPPSWYKGRGGGGWMEPLPGVFPVFRKTILSLVGGFDLLNKMGYILLVGALLEAYDVTNNGCHLGRHIGFYRELEIRLKPGEMEP